MRKLPFLVYQLGLPTFLFTWGVFEPNICTGVAAYTLSRHGVHIGRLKKKIMYC
jgi:hypothetical protein